MEYGDRQFPLLFTEHHGEHIIVEESALVRFFLEEANDLGQIEDMLFGNYFEEAPTARMLEVVTLYNKAKESLTTADIVNFFDAWTEVDEFSDENLRLQWKTVYR